CRGYRGRDRHGGRGARNGGRGIRRPRPGGDHCSARNHRHHRPGRRRRARRRVTVHRRQPRRSGVRAGAGGRTDPAAVVAGQAHARPRRRRRGQPCLAHRRLAGAGAARSPGGGRGRPDPAAARRRRRRHPHPAHPRPAAARRRGENHARLRPVAGAAFRKEAMTFLRALLRAAGACRATLPAWMLGACLAFALAPSDAFAQAAPAAAPVSAPATPAQPLPSVEVGNIGGQPVSMPLQVLALMTGITLLLTALLWLTSFTLIIIVLVLLRQAMGTGQRPSNLVLLALALLLTAMLMIPLFDQAWATGIAPYLDCSLDFHAAR